VVSILYVVAACDAGVPPTEPKKPIAVPRSDAAAAAECRTLTQVSDALFGVQRGTLGSAFADVKIGQQLTSLPERFASWRNGDTYVGEQPRVTIDGAVADVEWRGRPETVFAIDLEVAGTGLARLLEARWGAATMIEGRYAWNVDRRHERLRLAEHGCTASVTFEPYMTVDQLVRSHIEGYLGMSIRLIDDTHKAIVTRGNCYYADGCVANLRVASLESHAGPNCLYMTRGKPRGPSVRDLFKARAVHIMLSTCEEPVLPPWLDRVSDAAYAELEAALASAYGPATPCPNADHDAHAPKRFGARVILSKLGVEVVDPSHAEQVNPEDKATGCR
jgi:hypothetical protein